MSANRFPVRSLAAPMAAALLLFAAPLASLALASADGRFAHYKRFFLDGYYLSALGVTFGTALLVTALALPLAYPLAVTLWRAAGHRRALLVVALLSPFYANVAVKVFGWMVILPAWLEESYWAIVLVELHRALPFAVLLLAAAMARIDDETVEAAATCGAGPWRTFRTVVLPLTLPAAVGAGILVFSLSAASFVVPLLVGGRLAGRFLTVLMYQQFTIARNWGFAAAIAMVVLATSALAVALSSRVVAASALARLSREARDA